MKYSYELSDYLTPTNISHLEKRCEGKITYRYFSVVSDEISNLIYKKYPGLDLEKQAQIYNKIRPEFENKYRVQVIIKPIDRS